MPWLFLHSTMQLCCAWDGPQTLQYFKVTNFHCNISSFWNSNLHHSVCDSVSIIVSWWQRENHLPWNTPHMMKTLLFQRALFSNYKNHYTVNLWCAEFEIIPNCRNSLPKLQKLNECYSSHQLSLKKLVNLKYKMKLNTRLGQKGSIIIGVNSLLWTVWE